MAKHPAKTSHNSSHKETMFLDLPGANLKDFSLGDKITASITGKVIELRAARKFEFASPNDEDDTMPAALGIELIGSAKVKLAGNQFAKLSEEDDDDD